MRTATMTLLTAALLSLLPPAAHAAGSFDEAVASAQTIRSEALEVKRLLKDRQADASLLAPRMSAIEDQARSLKATLDALHGDVTLTPSQRAAVEKARTATETMAVILTNKMALLADADTAARQRGLLRGKADSIAKRAQMVERHISAVMG